jgi:hypothetical protein
MAAAKPSACRPIFDSKAKKSTSVKIQRPETSSCRAGRNRGTVFSNSSPKRQPGAPPDNNIAERALKKAILHRKNALFYKTMNGARVGDLFMSLIHTCELNRINPFDYLTESLRHQAELKARPAEWMPWNYRGALARTARPAAA